MNVKEALEARGKDEDRCETIVSWCPHCDRGPVDCEDENDELINFRCSYCGEEVDSKDIIFCGCGA